MGLCASNDLLIGCDKVQAFCCPYERSEGLGDLVTSGSVTFEVAAAEDPLGRGSHDDHFADSEAGGAGESSTRTSVSRLSNATAVSQGIWLVEGPTEGGRWLRRGGSRHNGPADGGRTRAERHDRPRVPEMDDAIFPISIIAGDGEEVYLISRHSGLASMLAPGGSLGALGGFRFAHTLAGISIDHLGRLFVGDAADVDNMSYEELLALGDRIGHVRRDPPSAEDLKKLPTWKVLPECDCLESNGSVPKFNETKEVTAGSCDCVICREKFTGGQEVKRLPCSHKYHAECIDTWLTSDMHQARLCPVCLQKVTF